MDRQYFEAILQLRNETSRSYREALDTIINETSKKGRADIFISKIDKVKGGADIYLSSKKFARELGSNMKAKYGAETSASPRLFSRNRQTSKDVYRLNVLVRLPDAEIGCLARSGDTIWQITGYLNGRLTGRNLRNGKREIIKNEDGFEILDGRCCSLAIVTKSKPHVEIMHPESFESVRVENAKGTQKKRLKVALIDGKAYEIN